MITTPSVFDIVIGETIEVSIQDNHLTFANFHSVSSDLQIRTISVDIEGLDRSTSTVSSSNRVRTSSGRGEGSTSGTIAPSIGVSVIRIGSSGNLSSSAVTDDVVTREREVRSSVDCHLSSLQ